MLKQIKGVKNALVANHQILDRGIQSLFGLLVLFTPNSTIECRMNVKTVVVNMNQEYLEYGGTTNDET